MAQFNILAGLSGDNSAGGSAADIVIQVANPLPNAPDKIYVLWKDANCQGVSATYNSETNQIEVTFIQVAAGQVAYADLFVQKEHSIWKGGQFIDATVNSTSNTVSPVGFTPDIVFVVGGQIPDGATWSYDVGTDTVTFNGLATGNTQVRIAKLHSIQHNQNGTTDASGVLVGQNEKPEILVSAGKLVGVSQGTINSNYNATNKQVSGLAASTAYVSIPVHSIFR